MSVVCVGAPYINTELFKIICNPIPKNQGIPDFNLKFLSLQLHFLAKLTIALLCRSFIFFHTKITVGNIKKLSISDN